jgi:hypothetical protein
MHNIYIFIYLYIISYIIIYIIIYIYNITYECHPQCHVPHLVLLCCQEAAAPSQLGPAVKAVLPIAVSVVVLGKADPGRNRISGMSNGKNYPRKK